MFFLQKIVEFTNVIDYLVKDQKLFYSTENKLFIFDFIDSKEVLTAPFIIRKISSFDNQTIILDDNAVPFLVDLETKTSRNFKFSNVFVKDVFKDVLIFFRRNPTKQGLIKKDSIFFETQLVSGVTTCSNDFFYGGFLNQIKCCHILSNQLLWQFDLSTIGTYTSAGITKPDEFGHYIAVLENEVWISTRGNKIVVLNNHTGELVIVFSWTSSPSEPFVPRSSEFYYSDILKKIVSFHSFYVIIDPLTKNIEKKVNSYNAFKELENIDISRTQLQDKYVMFKATEKNGGAVNHIGIFDIVTEQIIALHKLFNVGGFFIPSMEFPIMKNGKVYILDNKNTLHIFELV